MGISTPGESVSLERKIESSIFLCIPRDLNILGKSCTTFVIVTIVRNLSRGRSPCQRVNHVKSGVIYFSAFIFSYDTIHVSGTIHTWNRGLTLGPLNNPLRLFSQLSSSLGLFVSFLYPQFASLRVKGSNRANLWAKLLGVLGMMAC